MPSVSIGSAAGLRALLLVLRSLDWEPQMLTLWESRCTHADGTALHVVMGADSDLRWMTDGALCCSWSGLVWVQGSTQSVPGGITKAQCQLLSVTHLKELHRYITAPEVTDLLFGPSDALPWSLPQPLSWGRCVILAVILVLSVASVCSGLSLHGPPWQPVERRDVALIWDYRQSDLPEIYLRVFASTSPRPSRRPQVFGKGSIDTMISISHGMVAAHPTPWSYSIMRYLPCSLLSPLSSTRILR